MRSKPSEVAAGFTEAFSTVRKVDTAAPRSLSSTFPWQALVFVLDQSIKALGASAPMAENSHRCDDKAVRRRDRPLGDWP